VRDGFYFINSLFLKAIDVEHDARRQRMIDFLTEAYSSGRKPTKEEVEAAINGHAVERSVEQDEGKGEHERMMYEAAKNSDHLRPSEN
jgi:hypothetical protein